MRLFLATLVLGTALAGAWAAPAPMGPAKPPPAKEVQPPAAEKQPAQRVAWRTDLDAACKEAAATGRLVLIFFTAQWNQPCRDMETGTFANRAVADYVAQNFIPVKADDTRGPCEISKKFGVRIYPSVLILTSGEKQLHMILVPKTASQLLPILQQVAALPKLIDAQAAAPDDPEANFAVAGAMTGLNQLRRAKPYLEKMAELDPKNEKGRLAIARLMLAVVPMEDDNRTAALENLAAWMEDFSSAPEVPQAMYMQGSILYEMGRLQDARAVFDALRTRFPKHLKAYEADKAIDVIDARLAARAKAKGKTEAEKSKPAPAPPAQQPAAGQGSAPETDSPGPDSPAPGPPKAPKIQKP